MKHLLSASLAILGSVVIAATAPTIRTAAALEQAVFDSGDIGRAFDIEATITCLKLPRIMFRDETGSMYADDKRNAAGDAVLRAGDRIRLSGSIILSDKLHIPAADCRRIVRLSHGVPAPPQSATFAEVSSGRLDYELVTVRGEIIDSIRDDIDQMWRHLVLSDGNAHILVPVHTSSATNDFGLSSIGCHIEVTGLCDPAILSGHKFIGRGIEPITPADIRTLPLTRNDPFDVPDIGRLSRRNVDEFPRLGRHRISGMVTAVWNGESGMLKCSRGRIVRVNFAEAPLPPVGSCVDVSGFPFTDSYAICIRRAIWRKRDDLPHTVETPLKTSVKGILTAVGEQREYNWKMYGHTIRLRGKVLNLPAASGSKRQFYLGDGDRAIPIAVDALPTESLRRLAVGAEIDVTGVCVIETEARTPDIILPRITGCLLVVRRLDDLTILRMPPWWTAGRLFAVIALLVCILCGIICWNISLQRLSERRGREIAASNLARAKADLKTLERTRLAVELHDTISQNLTGAVLELKTADIVADSDQSSLHRLIKLAIRTLDTCREDLRNCIWDLRSLTLDESDVNEAIRKTVAPQTANARLAIRFRVPRERLSENVLHAILCIVRELALNAVRHGNATEIRIAGSIERDKLLFSVKDNGCGFDPRNIPGMAQGHFGLQGIRDRIKAFDGKMFVSSKTGKGAKVIMTLNLPSIPGTAHEENTHSDRR